MVRAIVLYDDEPDAVRYEQHAELCRKDADGCLPVQMEEIRQTMELLRRSYPDIHVEAYLAMRRGNSLSFHHLDG